MEKGVSKEKTPGVPFAAKERTVKVRLLWVKDKLRLSGRMRINFECRDFCLYDWSMVLSATINHHK